MMDRLRHIVEINEMPLEPPRTIELTVIIDHYYLIITEHTIFYYPHINLYFIGRTLTVKMLAVNADNGRRIRRRPKVRHVDHRCLRLCQSASIGLDCVHDASTYGSIFVKLVEE